MDMIAKGVAYVGAQDEDIDLFEGQYKVPQGISYNSYFIIDTHSAVLDAVDSRRTSDWLEAVARTVAEAGVTPSYLIVHHMEPDHSGSILEFCQAYPEAKIVCTKKAADMMANFFPSTNLSDRILTVADGDTLSLGTTTLTFATAPMVHWPEVMMTVDTQRGILYSADAFGSFAMWGADDAWIDEARRYYANIVGKYGPSVQTILKKLSKYNINTIAPLHGPMLSGSDVAQATGLYHKWSLYQPDTHGVLVAYASIYGGTAAVAREIASRLRESNAGEVVLIDLCRHDVSDAVAQAFRLDRMVLCSVTTDGDMMTAMHDFLYHLSCKALRGRRVALVENGSWASAAARRMQQMLADMKDMTVVEPIVSIRSRRTTALDQPLTDLIAAIAQ